MLRPHTADMKFLVLVVLKLNRHLPPMEIRQRQRGDVAARQPMTRLAGRLHSVLTSRVTHAVLLLAAAVGNGLMLGALQYLHELAGPLTDLTEALGHQAIQSR